MPRGYDEVLRVPSWDPRGIGVCPYGSIPWGPYGTLRAPSPGTLESLGSLRVSSLRALGVSSLGPLGALRVSSPGPPGPRGETRRAPEPSGVPSL